MLRNFNRYSGSIHMVASDALVEITRGFGLEFGMGNFSGHILHDVVLERYSRGDCGRGELATRLLEMGGCWRGRRASMTRLLSSGVTLCMCENFCTGRTAAHEYLKWHISGVLGELLKSRNTVSITPHKR